MNEWYHLSDEDVLDFNDTCKHIEEIINSIKNNPFVDKKWKNG
jgi:hypothetical protein